MVELEAPATVTEQVPHQQWIRQGMATSKSGRRPLERRHVVVVEWMERNLPTVAGKAPWGFWNRAARLVGGLTGQQLKDWFVRHRAHCAQPDLIDRWDAAIQRKW